jgi:hypothetical protein
MTVIRVILRNCFYITEVTWDIYMTTKRKRVKSSLYHFPPRLPFVCGVSSARHGSVAFIADRAQKGSSNSLSCPGKEGTLRLGKQRDEGRVRQGRIE